MLFFREKAEPSNVVPIEEAFPRGLFEPFAATGEPTCREHLFARDEVELSVHGIPRKLPALRCERCPAVLIRDLRP